MSEEGETTAESKKMSDATILGEEAFALAIRLVARLDQLGLPGEISVRVHLAGGAIELTGKSSALIAREISDRAGASTPAAVTAVELRPPPIAGTPTPTPEARGPRSRRATLAIAIEDPHNAIVACDRIAQSDDESDDDLLDRAALLLAFLRATAESTTTAPITAPDPRTLDLDQVPCWGCGAANSRTLCQFGSAHAGIEPDGLCGRPLCRSCVHRDATDRVLCREHFQKTRETNEP